MPKKPLPPLTVDRSSATPLQTQLCARFKALIETGALAAGEAVPSSRDLALELELSRNTVVGAYDRLLGEGYLAARPRSGLFVSDLFHAAVAPRTSPRPAAKVRSRTPQLRTPAPFRPSQPDVRLFPLALWNRMRNRGLKTCGSRILAYQEDMRLGLYGLRKSLASYLRSSRGVRCDWRQIAVTSGSQQALYMLGQLLVQPGNRVLMEDPGYPGAQQTWLARGAQVDPVPVDDNGLVPPTGAAAAHALLYTTPSRQYPTGASIPVARRLALVDWASRSGTYIVEDDYDSEFRYSRPPLPSLQGLDRGGRVIYVGTMSKALFPSLRIGFVVLPESLIEPFSNLRGIIDDQGPIIDQAALAEFIDSGAFYTHIRRCRREYGARQEAFLHAAKANGLPLRFPHTDGGMNIAGFLDEDRPLDAAECSRVFAAEGFDVPQLSRYAIASQPKGFLFGFTAFGPPRIRTEVARFASVLRTLL